MWVDAIDFFDFPTGLEMISSMKALPSSPEIIIITGKQLFAETIHLPAYIKEKMIHAVLHKKAGYNTDQLKTACQLSGLSLSGRYARLKKYGLS